MITIHIRGNSRIDINHFCSSFSLRQRLGRLVREGKVVEALKLGLNIYEGRAPAVIGMTTVCSGNCLPGGGDKDAIVYKITEIVALLH